MGWQACAAICGVCLAMVTQAAETVSLNHLVLQVGQPMVEGFSGGPSEWRGAGGEPDLRDGVLHLASAPGADATAWCTAELQGHVLIRYRVTLADAARQWDLRCLYMASPSEGKTFSPMDMHSAAQSGSACRSANQSAAVRWASRR